MLTIYLRNPNIINMKIIITNSEFCLIKHPYVLFLRKL